MSGRFLIILVAAVGALAAAGAAHAEAAPFDLAGPALEVKVTRGADTRPIGEVPNLNAGDRLWIKPDLPATQSERYLLVAAFLRGSTNPPPANWFFRCETWKAPCAQDGLTLTVPDDAQQVLVFLAPATGGDFKTLVNAVQGRPGAFVRASQDLMQAALDRSRLEMYLTAIHSLDAEDQARLVQAASLLARSLAIKVDKNCLDKMPELQAPCLMQGQAALILNDGHSTSIVEALTSGPATDLAMEASYTPQLSYGYYSPYIASVLDIARILESFHTAQYQYIPALARLHGDQLLLTLNTPPSFHNPKSVLVAALPAVEPAQLPPLHAVDPKELFCARKAALVLPVEGAPLVFSTQYAHGLKLTLSGDNGTLLELPVTADAERGGFTVDTSGLAAVQFGSHIRGALHGKWGFDAYQGPSFTLVNSRGQTWALAAGEEGAPIVGREGTVHLSAGDVSCLESVTVEEAPGHELKAEWRPVKADQVEVKLPLENAAPGALTLLVAQYGAAQPQPLTLQAFSQPGHLEGFTIHAGDTQGVLTGTRLDQVGRLVLKGVEFDPGKFSSSQGSDELVMAIPNAAPGLPLRPRETLNAKVTLKDGRVFDVAVLVAAPRPSVRLLGRSVQRLRAAADEHIELADADELPQNARLTFSLRALSPPKFARDEKIEVAAEDESFSTVLAFGSGITLEDASVAVASLDPASAFGASAFGRLQFRVIGDGGSGDWQPLGTLVRLPVLTALSCPAALDLACKLSGDELYLIDAISGDAAFSHPVQIPEGFPGNTVPVPHPSDGRLYLKLRDNQLVVNTAALVAQPLPLAADAAAAQGQTRAPPPAATTVAPAPATAPTLAPSPAATLAPAPASSTPAPAPAPDDH